jgi:hypothetical protein
MQKGVTKYQGCIVSNAIEFLLRPLHLKWGVGGGVKIKVYIPVHVKLTKKF